VLVAEAAELAAVADNEVEEMLEEVLEEVLDEDAVVDAEDGGDSTPNPCEKPWNSVVDGSSPGLSVVSSHAN